MNKANGPHPVGLPPAQPNEGVLPSLEDCVRIWTKALLVGDYNRACKIELETYNHCINPTESLAAWDEWQEQTARQRLLLCEYYCQAFPSRPQVGNGRLGIVLHNFSGLAHEQQVGRQIKKLIQTSGDFKVYIIYAFGGSTHNKTAAEIYGVDETNIVFLQAKTYTSAAVSLDSVLERLGIGTVLYPSTAFFCFWMSLICRHGDQRFLQMKYFPRQIGRISKWACGWDAEDGLHKVVKGEIFIRLPPELESLPVVKLLRPPIIADNFVFGSISRVDKIQHPSYIDFVLKIFKRFPNSRYLITGRDADECRVPDNLSNHPQAKFCGWVRPEEFIKELDFYLDPWPAGGGDMSFLSIINGLPYFSLQTSDGLQCGPLSTVMRIAQSSSISDELIRCIPPDEEHLMGEIALVVSDHIYREKVSSAWADAGRRAFIKYSHRRKEFLFG